MKRLDNEQSKTINYSGEIAELESVYERQFDLIKKGNTDLVTLELVMLGKALDFVHFTRKKLGISLDTSKRSVAALEEVLDAFERGVVQDNFFSPENGSIAESISAYLGILIIANIGGKWEDTEQGAAVSVNDRLAFVSEYIEKRLLGLSQLDAVTYFDSVSLAQ